MRLICKIFITALLLISISSVCNAELFTLNNSQSLNCEPKISRNGKYVGYCGHTAGRPPTATWEILPQYLNDSAPYTPSRFRVYQPTSSDGHPERISTSGVGINSRGFGYWFNATNIPFQIFRYWTRSAFGRPVDVEFYSWGAETNYSTSDANDFGEMVGMAHTPGTLAGRAAIFNASGHSRILPTPSGVRGDSSAISINNSGLIGGHLVFLNVRDGLVRTEPHAVVWRPSEPQLPKSASYDRLPLDLHSPHMAGLTVIGSTISAIGPSRNPWIGGSLTIQETSARATREHSAGFLREGLNTDAELTVLRGNACKIIDPVDPRLENVPCTSSGIIGINNQYAVGNATYSLPDGGIIIIPFYVPLAFPGEGIYDLNRHIPTTSPWDNLSSVTDLSENNVAVGIGYFRTDIDAPSPAWRGFAVQL